MAGTLTVDTIQSDSSYASRINVTSNVAFSSPVTFNTPANFAGGMQIGGQDATFGGMRNRVINGDMKIDQRNAGASVTPTTNATYVVDRWMCGLNQSSKFSVQRVTTAPPGFTNSSLITSLSAYSSVAADFLYYAHKIEGLNCGDLGFGTADAKTVTLSFWVRSSLSGNFSVRLVNSSFNRSYVTTYTINSTNTWEYKTVTIPGDTTGTWSTNTDSGIEVAFDLGSGSTYTTSSTNSWQASAGIKASGSVSLLATNGATLNITGVQFEKGSAASPFEYRQYGQELALCQRYFEKSWHPNTAVGTADYYGVVTSIIPGSTGQYTGTVNMSVSKRSTTPTLTFYNPSSGASGTSRGSNGSNYTTTSYWYPAGTTFSFNISSFPAGSNFTFHWTCSDEL